MQLWLTWLLLGVVQLSGPVFGPPVSKPGVHVSGLHFGPQRHPPAPDVSPAGLCREGRNVWTELLYQGTWICEDHSAGGSAPGSCDLECGRLPSETKHGWSLNSRKHGDPSLVSEVWQSLILSRPSSCCSSSPLLLPDHFSTLCFRNRNSFFLSSLT